MTLAAGARLGPYEMVALIGRGGMGEVYRAHDIKLNRDVALKTQPELFALDVDRLRTWKRRIPAALGLFAVLGITGLSVWVFMHPDSSQPRPISRFAVRAPIDVQGIREQPNRALAISPDGSTVVYVGRTEGSGRLFRRAMDRLEGEGIAGSEGGRAPFFSPDGEWIGFEADGILKRVQVVSTVGVVKALPPLETHFNERAARFSPDGAWLAYVSNESGRDEMYERPYPGLGGKTPVSRGGGTEPVWSPSASELFYRQGDHMLAVTLQLGPALVISTPRLLFKDASYVLDAVGNANYDVFPDGQRFVIVQAAERIEEPSVVLVQNWFEELKRLAPGK